jgi:lipopolysaccharide/colanic/teichoic acid biosynthesis glycosyltransferase
MYKIIFKRLIDFTASLVALIIFSPLMLVIILLQLFFHKGKVWFRQQRPGYKGRLFYILKFKTMSDTRDEHGELLPDVKRLTPWGNFLRKSSLDELPQLINVFVGDMSLVGPRPEVRKYVDVYTPEQLKLLSVRPGITDYASLEYLQESEILGRATDPEKAYIEEVMPQKLAIAARYLEHPGVITDIKIILLTLRKIIAQ